MVAVANKIKQICIGHPEGGKSPSISLFLFQKDTILSTNELLEDFNLRRKNANEEEQTLMKSDSIHKRLSTVRNASGARPVFQYGRRPVEW